MASLRGIEMRDCDTMLLTTPCLELIGHALGFLWLEQIVNSLFPGEAIVALEDVLGAAAKFGDTAFTTTTAALARIDLVSVAEGAVQAYTAGGKRRSAALEFMLTMPPDCAPGEEGVYNGDALVIRTTDPDTLLAAARVQRAIDEHPFQAELAALVTPAAFITKIGNLFTTQDHAETMLADLQLLTNLSSDQLKTKLLPGCTAPGDKSTSSASGKAPRKRSKAQCRDDPSACASEQSAVAAGGTSDGPIKLAARSAASIAADHRSGPE